MEKWMEVELDCVVFVEHYKGVIKYLVTLDTELNKINMTTRKEFATIMSYSQATLLIDLLRNSDCYPNNKGYAIGYTVFNFEDEYTNYCEK